MLDREETHASLISRLILEAKAGNWQKFAAITSRINSGLSETESSRRIVYKNLFERLEKMYGSNIAVPESTGLLAPTTITGDRPGISLVTCCMNRSENLIKALPSWLAQNSIDEIIIVDWSSDIPVQHTLQQSKISDKRIRVVRVEDEPRWILSFAFNIGIRYARYSQILKVDADIVLAADFFEKNKLTDTSFITGHWEIAEPGQEHINGFFFANTVNLASIKGFNEYITTYGWDDDDIYNRLSELGLSRNLVDPQTIHHLEHDDVQRLGIETGTPTHAYAQLNSDTLYKIRRNRFIANVMPKWNGDHQFAPFEVSTDRADFTELRRLTSELPHYTNGSIEEDANYYAAVEIISWRCGPEAYHIPRSDFLELLNLYTIQELEAFDLHDWSKYLEQSNAEGTSPKAPYTQTRKLRFYVDAQHGLGNRLRAIASGATIAQATERELIIVWQPDHHCECEMTDLFDYVGPVISEAFVQEAPKLGLDTYNYMEAEGGQKDRPILLSDRDAYYRGAFVAKSEHTGWELENRFLKSLIPSEAVRDLVAPFELGNHIAAHIRMEGGAGLDGHAYEQVSNWTEKDHELLHFWREKSNFRHFITHIDKIFESEPEAKLFLATDMQQTYDIFQGYYGERVDFLSRHVYDRSKEQIIYALADAILLSKCKRLLGSTWSSFSEMAMRLTDGYEAIEMSGEDF